MPHVESLSLFRAEESLEEIDTREALGLETADQHLPVAQSPDDVSIIPTILETTTVQHAPPTFPPLTESTIFIPQPQLTTQPAPAPSSPKGAQPVLSQPPSPLPFSSVPVVPASGSSVPVTTLPVHTFAEVAMDDDEDEEMPVINMDSDSDC